MSRLSVYPSPVLIARAQNGDPRASRALLERSQDAAFAYACALLGSLASAEAAARAALAEARGAIDEVRDAQNYDPWLRRIVESRCAAARGAENPEEMPAGELAARGDPRASELLERVLGLPLFEERAVALLRHLAGAAPGDVARFLEIPLATVENRLVAVRRRLKKRTYRELETGLAGLRPSRDPAFVESVLASVP